MPSASQQQITLGVGQVLVVTADASSTGSVSRLPDVPGTDPRSYLAISASTSTSFGPYKVVSRWVVNSTSGLLSATASNGPSDFTFAIAAGGANVSEVTITIVDETGATVPGVHHFDLWLSDAATGAGLTATTASGAVTAKASSGADLGALTAKKMLRAQTKTTGVFVLSITDTVKTGFFVCARLSELTGVKVAPQLVTASYG
jgi:hypothetical protein